MSAGLRQAFIPPATLADFYDDRSTVRGVMGPIGGGKTVLAMCIDVLVKACRQKPSPVDGVRYTREAILRRTYSRVEEALLATWKEWIDPKVFRSPITGGMPMKHHLHFNQAAHGQPDDIVDLEVVFMAGFEKPDDVEKLRGHEFGRIRLNEATEFSEDVFIKIRERANRYPRREHGFCTEPGVVLDFNAPDESHWLYKYMEMKTPAGWRFWRQPPAVLEDPHGSLESMDGTHYRLNDTGDPDKGILPADNLVNLPPGYYEEKVGGNTDSWIRVFLGNRFAFLRDGDPVHPAYNDDLHYAREDLEAYPGLPLLVSFDCGPNAGYPACVIFQVTPRGQMRVLDELWCDHYTGGVTFLDERVIPHLANYYPNFRVELGGHQWLARGWGDPAGRAGEGYEPTFFDECRKRNLHVEPTYDHQNLVSLRVGALDKFLTTLVDGGKPAFLLSSRCQMLRAGLGGQYKWDKFKTGANKGALRREPTKNLHSHPCEALEYGALGVRGRESDNQMARQLAQVQRLNRSLQPMQSGVGY